MENQDEQPQEYPLGTSGLSARTLINSVSVLLAIMVLTVGATVALRANPAWLQRLFPYSGSRVYVVSEDSHTVMALKASDGTPVWRFTLPAPPANASTLPVTNMLLDAETLYVATATGTGAAIIAIDTRDGTQRWRYERAHAALTLFHVAGGSVYVSENGLQFISPAFVPYARLTALDVNSGKARWQYQLPDTNALTFAYSPQTIIIGVDNFFANITAPSTLVAFNAGDGSKRWHVHVPDSHALYPVIVDDMVYVRADYALVAYSIRDGEQQWTATSTTALILNYPFVAQVAVAVTDDDGILSTYSATGALRWHAFIQEPQRIAAASTNSAYVDASIFTADDNTYGLTALNRDDGSMQWRFAIAIPDSFSEPPLLLGDVIYLHLANAVVALNAVNGSTRWRTPVARPPAGTPLTLARETLYLGAGNTIIALDAATGKIRWHTQVGYVALAPLVSA